MENDRIAKRVYIGQCIGTCPVDRPRKRWIATMKDFKKEVWMLGKQGEWCMWFVRGECMVHSPGDKALILTRCHSCLLSGLYETILSVAEPTTYRA